MLDAMSNFTVTCYNFTACWIGSPRGRCSCVYDRFNHVLQPLLKQPVNLLLKGYPLDIHKK